MAINNKDISANEVADDGSQSSVGVPVMQTVVSNKTSTFDFFSFTYMTNVPCFIYTYRNLLKLSDI